MNNNDADEIINEVFRLTGQRIDKDDPIIAVALLNRSRLDIIINRVSKIPAIIRRDINDVRQYYRYDNKTVETDAGLNSGKNTLVRFILVGFFSLIIGVIIGQNLPANVLDCFPVLGFLIGR